MNNYLIECCANSVQSAIYGEQGGANRTELCSQLDIGGITPLKADILKAKKTLRYPLHVLIRPRGGDFVYSNREFSKILSEIRFCKKSGCDGVVIGSLNRDSSINIKQTMEMVDIAKPMHITFHRAFDKGKDLLNNLEDVISCKCDTLLTSGQKPDVNIGIHNLKKIIRITNNRINILAGGGVNQFNIGALYSIGIRNFHLSGIRQNTTDPLLIKDATNKIKGLV